MITLQPSILEHDGKKTFAVLPYEEFQRVQDELDDYGGRLGEIGTGK